MFFHFSRNVTKFLFCFFCINSGAMKIISTLYHNSNFPNRFLHEFKNSIKNFFFPNEQCIILWIYIKVNNKHITKYNKNNWSHQCHYRNCCLTFCEYLNLLWKTEINYWTQISITLVKLNVHIKSIRTNTIAVFIELNSSVPNKMLLKIILNSNCYIIIT